MHRGVAFAIPCMLDEPHGYVLPPLTAAALPAQANDLAAAEATADCLHCL
jgi:hypothetical protein